MNEIRWGIIGCGNVTEIKSGPAFNKVPNSTLVAVMRRDRQKAEDYANRHHVPKWYDNAGLLINDPDVNAIYVATPPSTHEQYAIAALKSRKPVYVEKPMSTDAVSAERIMSAAKEYNTKLCVAHYRREMPFFKKIRQLIDDRKIGDIKKISLEYSQAFNTKGFAPDPSNWRLDPAVSGGGIFHDLAPHQLDLMLHFFGPPTSVEGNASNHGGHYEADDVVSATVRFRDNVVFRGKWDFVSLKHEDIDHCRITGSDGYLDFSIFTMDKLLINYKGTEDVLTFEPLQHVQQPMINAVVEYFLGQRNNPCPAEDGVAVMRMIDEIVRR